MKLNDIMIELVLPGECGSPTLGASLRGLGDVLEMLPVPVGAELREYIETCVPNKVGGSGIADFLSPEDILEENLHAVPSCVCVPFGYLTIALDGGGGTYSVNTRDGKVYHLSHEKVWEEGIPDWEKGGTDILPLSAQSIAHVAERRWNSIRDFLLWVKHEVQMYDEAVPLPKILPPEMR